MLGAAPAPCGLFFCLCMCVCVLNRTSPQVQQPLKKSTQYQICIVYSLLPWLFFQNLHDIRNLRENDYLARFLLRKVVGQRELQKLISSLPSQVREDQSEDVN